MVTSTPLIAGDKVVVGGWVTDNQQIGNPSGVLRAYDAVTGQFAWAWDMGNPGYHGLPDEGGEYTRGTPNVWSNTAYDPELNLIYAPTGNSSPDYFDGELRTKEAEENASSVVAIDAATGERRWVYQTVHRDIWDWDVPSQPVLVEHPQEWRRRADPGRGAAHQARRDLPARPPHRRSDLRHAGTIRCRRTRRSARSSRRRSPSRRLPHFRDDRVENNMWGLTPLDQLCVPGRVQEDAL